ncbi:MAG: hypothetical protein KZQ79_04595, partial [Candidatus Thiodiazotropha sp. (ex Lucinoma borealis)]|nr:hypothetical protein [Candidatus Thiodiazotropha sp. (ex Lucinoma borealis)]
METRLEWPARLHFFIDKAEGGLRPPSAFVIINHYLLTATAAAEIDPKHLQRPPGYSFAPRSI